jgi:hypothetical protein
LFFFFARFGFGGGAGAGGPPAAVWACLPTQVYQATWWLQDDIFAGTFAGFLFFFIACLHSAGGCSLLYGLIAGMALAYMQYAKETACLLVLPTTAALLVATLRDRRALWKGAAVLLGFLGLHALAGLLFWHQDGSFWSYWAATAAVVQGKATLDRPAYEVLGRCWQRLGHKWLLGYAVLAFPILGAAVFLSRRTPHRLLLALLLGVQLFVWYGATSMTPGDDRYTEQVSVPYVVITVLGLALLVDRASAGRRTRLGLMLAASCGLVIATAAALHRDYQQYRWGRTQSLRTGFDVCRAMAPPNEPMYTFEPGGGKVSYTRRTLYQFAGFEAPAGGFRDWRPGELPTSGWAILSHLDWPLGGDNLPIPANWLLEYEGGTPAGGIPRAWWTHVYRIMPPALAEGKLERVFQWPTDPHIRIVGKGVVYLPGTASEQQERSPVVQVSASSSLVRFQDTTTAAAPLKYGIWVPPGQRELRYNVRVRTVGVARFELGFLCQPVSGDGQSQQLAKLYFWPVTVERGSAELHSTVAVCATGEYVAPLLRIPDAGGPSFEILDAEIQAMRL